MGTAGEDRGQSVVEFTLMLPFVLLLIMALAEFGAAFYTYITINNATSEAARWASVARVPDPTCSDAIQGIQWRAAQMSRGLLACTDPNVAFQITYEDASSGQPARGTGVTVRVTREYQALTPLPGLVSFLSAGTLLPANWAMTACSDARLEQAPPTGTYTIGASDCGA